MDWRPETANLIGQLEFESITNTYLVTESKPTSYSLFWNPRWIKSCKGYYWKTPFPLIESGSQVLPLKKIQIKQQQQKLQSEWIQQSSGEFAEDRVNGKPKALEWFSWEKNRFIVFLKGKVGSCIFRVFMKKSQHASHIPSAPHPALPHISIGGQTTCEGHTPLHPGSSPGCLQRHFRIYWHDANGFAHTYFEEDC